MTTAERLDVLALAPLPCRHDGRAALQVGGSIQCERLLTGLARLGHDVRVIAVGPLQPTDLEPGDVGTALEVDWFAVEKLNTAAPPSVAEVERRRDQLEAALDRAMADRRPDVAILGNESHPWYAADAFRDRGIATVVTAQGVPTAELSGYPDAAREELARQLGKADLVVAVSEHLEEVLRGLGVDRVRTIETGVDAEAFRPRPRDPELHRRLGIEQDRLVVGSFAHLRPEKRVLDVVASAEIVLRSEPRAVYLVVASGPQREEAMRLAATRGVAESVRFVDELDHAEVPAHMALCDVVVVASEREGYSLICREAQASECALVVSDIPAGRAAAREGEAGVLFRVGDVEDLAAKVVALAHGEGRRRSLAVAARSAALENSGDGWVRSWSDAIAAAPRARGGMHELTLTKADGRLAVRKRYSTAETGRHKALGSGARNEALLGARLPGLVPAELSVSRSEDYEEVCLEWRVGASLEAGEVDPERARGAGQALARIHGLPGEWYGSIDGHHRFERQADVFARRWAHAVSVLETADVELARDVEGWARPRVERLSWPRPTLVHGDFGATNLLWTGIEVTTVLDWEFARYGDPREDWAKVSMGTRFPDPNSFGSDRAVIAALHDGYVAAGGAAEAIEPDPLYEAYFACVLAVFLDDDARFRWLAELARG